MNLSQVVNEGRNSTNVKCPFCDSLIMTPKSGHILKEEQKLPTVTQKKDTPSVTTENISDWWVVEDMFTFDNIGFTHSVGTLKYLSCADCEMGPVGYHDVETNKNYVALTRVKHE